MPADIGVEVAPSGDASIEVAASGDVAIEVAASGHATHAAPVHMGGTVHAHAAVTADRSETGTRAAHPPK